MNIRNEKINGMKILVPADKTSNFYELSVEEYEKLRHDNVTKSYRKADANAKLKIDLESKPIVTGLDLAERMEIYAQKEAFITLKDHKENFSTRPTCRLINPAKREIGEVSRQIIGDINRKLRIITKLQQWRSTQNSIDWFMKVPNKSRKKFLKFDIENYYPSISQDTLLKALTWAESYDVVPDGSIQIIMDSRKSLLFCGGKAWCKKSGGLFDVTMGSPDGAEICELVGLYLLSQLTQILPRDSVGLYRDDGLAEVDLPGPESDRVRKNIETIFHNNGFKVKVEPLSPHVDHLDVNLDFSTGRYWPYRKPNCETRYIDTKSNHPPNIIKEIPAAVGRRISDISCDENTFNNAKPYYEEALAKSGYKSSLEYREKNSTTDNNTREKKKRNRKRKVIWFNPPFNKNVNTDVGRKFLSLIDKHFSSDKELSKLFNKNNIKVSYSCMPNMEQIIKSHNAKLLKLNSTQTEERKKSCNCQRPGENFENCPLKGKCTTASVIYKATVTAVNEPVKHYIGLTERSFKERFGGHKSSFTHREQSNASELSKYMWKLKDEGKNGQVEWEILQKAFPYQCGARKCDVCLSEKLQIITADQSTLLNKRSELISTCRHQAKFRFSSKQWEKDYQPSVT